MRRRLNSSSFRHTDKKLEGKLDRKNNEPESETCFGVGTKHLSKYGSIRRIMESNFSLNQLGIITEDF